jgi:small-conductance mechanosensitive channel
MDRLANWMQPSALRLEVVFGTVFILLAASACTLALNRLVRRLAAEIQPRLHLPSETVLFLTRIMSSVLWVCVGLLILNVWGISVTGLWTTLVSIAAVIGVGFLAVWTIVSNATASLFITIWHPFRFGETVELLPENLKGRVIDRNLMFTVLRETEGTILQIPNNFFFQKAFRVTENGDRYLFEFLGRGPATESTGATQSQDGR